MVSEYIPLASAQTSEFKTQKCCISQFPELDSIQHQQMTEMPLLKKNNPSIIWERKTQAQAINYKTFYGRN